MATETAAASAAYVNVKSCPTRHCPLSLSLSMLLLMIVLFSSFSLLHSFSPVANQLVAHSHGNDGRCCCCYFAQCSPVDDDDGCLSARTVARVSHSFILSPQFVTIRSCRRCLCSLLRNKIKVSSMLRWKEWKAMCAASGRCRRSFLYLFCSSSFSVFCAKLQRWCTHFFSVTVKTPLLLAVSPFYSSSSFCFYSCQCLSHSMCVRFDLKLQVIYRWQLLWTDEKRKVADFHSVQKKAVYMCYDHFDNYYLAQLSSLAAGSSSSHRWEGLQAPVVMMGWASRLKKKKV